MINKEYKWNRMCFPTRVPRISARLQTTEPSVGTLFDGFHSITAFDSGPIALNLIGFAPAKGFPDSHTLCHVLRRRLLRPGLSRSCPEVIQGQAFVAYICFGITRIGSRTKRSTDFGATLAFTVMALACAHLISTYHQCCSDPNSPP